MRRWLGRILGDRGERAAARFLRRKGYTLLARGHRTAIGEIDLVALDGSCVVFVEVKTRADHSAGHPAEAVTAQKQRKLTNLALEFLKKHKLLGRSARFDVLALTWPADQHRPIIEHFPNAFEPVGRGQLYS